MNVQPALQQSVVLLSWKSKYNISDNAYTSLLSLLNGWRGSDPLLSFKATVTQLKKTAGFQPVAIDCCINLCQAYAGPFRRAVSCVGCGAPRYRTTLPGDEDIPTSAPTEDVPDGVAYWDLLLNIGVKVLSLSSF